MVNSAVSMATLCPSLLISTNSQSALLRVYMCGRGRRSFCSSSAAAPLSRCQFFTGMLPLNPLLLSVETLLLFNRQSLKRRPKGRRRAGSPCQDTKRKRQGNTVCFLRNAPCGSQANAIPTVTREAVKTPLLKAALAASQSARAFTLSSSQSNGRLCQKGRPLNAVHVLPIPPFHLLPPFDGLGTSTEATL